MAAPKGGSDSGNTSVIVMIIFIVLFLISATFAIIFYVNLETANRRASDATAKLERMGNSTQITAVEQLAESAGLDNGSTFDKLDAVVKFFSETIVGVDAVNYSMATAKATAYARLETLWEKIAEVQGLEVETAKAAGLAGAAESLVALLNEMASEFTSYQDQVAAKLSSDQISLQKNEEQIAQLQSEIDSLGMTVANMKNQTNDNIDDIRGRFESHISSIQKEKDLIVSNTQEYRKQLDSELQEAALLREKTAQMEKFLRDTRQKPTQEVEALDPDGTIISVDAREQMVYINLCAKDKIYRGLTFSVYDGLDKTVPSSGMGKATIEVVEILDSISRCRIVDNPEGNPVIKGDIIANLIWDANREFVFCLVGDFDFNMDGELDIDGANRIETLITGWGGKVQDFVSVDTDFIVYGNEPADDRAEGYNKALDEALRLGVPSFNTQRFFRFIGYSKKQVIN